MINARTFTVFCVSLLVTSVCLGQPVASDSFETAAVGSADKIESGEGFVGGWTLHGVGKTDVTIVEKTLSYAAGDIKIEGGSKALAFAASDAAIAMLATRDLPEQNGPVYLSFLFEMVENKGDGNDFFQIGFDGGKSSSPLASVVINGKFYPRSNTEPGSAPSTGAVKAGETSLVVVKVAKSSDTGQYDSVTVFVNPTSMDESAARSVKQDKPSGMSMINRLMLRKAFTEVGDTFIVDAIRVGSTFESVLK